MASQPSKIGFGGLTALGRDGGQIVVFAHFVSKFPESVDYLVVNCRYTLRLWGLVKNWLRLHVRNKPLG
jgi:hypothetical protein